MLKGQRAGTCRGSLRRGETSCVGDPSDGVTQVADSISSMELYGQDAEARLLSELMRELRCRTVIDVGAERGELAGELLQAGAEELHTFEPHPDNLEALHARFDADARVTVHEHAVSDSDGNGELHVSADPSGVQLPFGHTLLKRAGTDEIEWGNNITVRLRSLGSLIDAGELPIRAGVLKIDTEGHDLAVVRGMGPLEADVVMVEHWVDLPHGLGRCPWTAQDMLAELEPRGFSHFAFIAHRGEFVTLKWDDPGVERGAMGNLIFLHDSALSRLLPAVLNCAGWLAERAVREGQTYMHAANDRLALVDELKEAADERLALIHKLEQIARDRLTMIEETVKISEERLQALDSANAQLKDAHSKSGWG
jgi:FkbM family methyltransferase